MDHELVANELYGRDLKNHVDFTPHFDEADLYYNAEYSYKREQTIMGLIKRTT